MNIKEQIQVCENNLLNAMKEQDVDALDRLIHDDLMFIGPTGELITKEMDLETYRLKQMNIEAYDILHQAIHLYQDSAVVVVTLDLKAIFMNQPIQNRFNYVRTWKKIQDQWMIIAGACVALHRDESDSQS